METVSTSDDGMFSTEYVVPPTLSIALGTSVAAVNVTKNEDSGFSITVNGEDHSWWCGGLG